VIQKSDNGGSPSKNGAGHEKGGRQIELVITDRLDALERALGTVRRRQMTFQVQSLAVVTASSCWSSVPTPTRRSPIAGWPSWPRSWT
jgi:hypothetical protein